MMDHTRHLGHRRTNSHGCISCGRCCRRFTVDQPDKLKYLAQEVTKKPRDAHFAADMLIWLERHERGRDGKGWWWVTCRHYSFKENACTVYFSGQRPRFCEAFTCYGRNHVNDMGEQGPKDGTAYIGSCVTVGDTPEGLENLNRMVEDSQAITYRTMLKHCDLLPFAACMGYDKHPNQGLTLKNDWHVGYYKSHWGNKVCYYLVHSAIEYIWVIATPRHVSAFEEKTEEPEEEFSLPGEPAELKRRSPLAVDPNEMDGLPSIHEALKRETGRMGLGLLRKSLDCDIVKAER